MTCDPVDKLYNAVALCVGGGHCCELVQIPS
jgi:hypothetical protein